MIEIIKKEIENGTSNGQLAFWDNTIWKHTETSELFWDDINKRLGIGTPLPLKKCTIADVNGDQLQLQRLDDSIFDTQTISTITFAGNDPTPGNQGGYIKALAAQDWESGKYGSDLQFGTTNINASTVTTKMTILDNGNVGIGNSNPSFKLDIVGGTIRLDSSASADLILDKGATNRGADVLFRTAGGQRWTMGCADSDFVGNGDDFRIGKTSSDPNFFIARTTQLTGMNTSDPDAMLEIVSNSSAEECLHLKGAASQSADLMIVTDSSDTILTKIKSDGEISLIATVDGDTPKLSFYQTGSERGFIQYTDGAPGQDILKIDSDAGINFYPNNTLAWSFDVLGAGTLITSSDDSFTVKHSSATGSPKISLLQDTAERGFLQYQDTGDILRLDSDGSIVLASNNTPILTLVATGITIGNAGAGIDYTITVNGETNDGVITWMETDDVFKFNDDITMNADRQINFRESTQNIQSFNSNFLDYTSGTTHRFRVASANTNITFEFIGTSNSGQFIWGEDEDAFLFADDFLMIASERVGFRDAGIGIYSQANSFLDLFADGAVRIGNSAGGAPTTYLNIEPGGDLTFVGSGSGLAFGEIFCKGANEDVDFSGGSGQGNKQQISCFDTNGNSNNMTPDHSNDHITVTKSGMYLATISLTIDSQAGNAAQFHFSMYKNDGATEFTNVHVHRNMPAGAGGNGGSCSLSGIVDLAVNDTIELWGWNVTNTQDVTINAVTMSLVQIGGT